jgi:hypothetical protein
MPHNPTPLALFQPWTLWMQWAARSMEMWLAAGQVIGARTHRMARAGHNPSARDRKEFALMGTEKMQAAAQSWAGMFTALAPLQAQWARIALAGLAPVHRTATANARRLNRGRHARRG